MGEDTQGLKREISDTRNELSRDVDALTEKVSPGRVVDRRMQRAKDRVTSMRDRVMGSASDVGERTRSGVSATGETVRSKTEGSPLAAGLVAFGAGLLVAALIPPSKKETELASQAVDAAKEYGGPIADEAASIGQEVGQDLKDRAQEAAESVRETAAQAADRVKEEGRSSAQTVAEEAKQGAS